MRKNTEKHVKCDSDPWCIVAAISEAVKKTSIKHMILGRGFHGTGLGIPSYVLGLPREGTLIVASTSTRTYERLLSQIHFSLVGCAEISGHVVKTSLRRLIALGFNSLLSSPIDLREAGYVIQYKPPRRTLGKLCGTNLYMHDYAECLKLLKLMHNVASVVTYNQDNQDGILQAALEASTLLDDQCRINLGELINIITGYMTMCGPWNYNT